VQLHPHDRDLADGVDRAGARTAPAADRITPDVAGGAFWLEQPLSGNRPGYRVRAVLSDAAGEVVSETVRADLDLAPRLRLSIPADRQRLWSPTIRICTTSGSNWWTPPARSSTSSIPMPGCGRCRSTALR